MMFFRSRSRGLARLMLVAFLASAVAAPAAQAGMVGNAPAFGAGGERAAVDAALARADVQARLVQMGVDPAEVQDRVAALTDSELQSLATHLEQLPAGGDIVGAAVFVFLVLLITDIAGLTDIFPFVKK